MAMYRDPGAPTPEPAGDVVPLGASGLPVALGVVRQLDAASGCGVIARASDSREVRFDRAALPGDHQIAVGTPVVFEIVEAAGRLTAHNIQPATGH